VLILGCGPIGLICMLVAKAFGAERVRISNDKFVLRLICVND